MLNPQILAQVMRLNPEQAKKLQEAWQQANQAAQNINTQEEAFNILQKAGIKTDFLAKVKSYLNNPMANIIAGMAGIDLNKLRMGLDTLAGGNTSRIHNTQNNTVVKNPGNKLDKLRQGLAQLK